MKKGLWVLKGSNPPLYTDRAADVIVHKPTGKQYLRGEAVLFKDNIPETVDSNEEYDFVYLKRPKWRKLTEKDLLNELYINSLLNK